MLNNAAHQDTTDFQQVIALLPQAILLQTPLGFVCLNRALCSWTTSDLHATNTLITTQNLVESFQLDNDTKNNLTRFLSRQSTSNQELICITHLTTGPTLRWQWLSDDAQLMVEDITQWHQQLSELQTLSDTDSLTGLANRRRFQRDFTRLIAQGARNGQTGALILFDIDNLKSINDKWGHATGDKILSEFGFLAKPCIRPYECLARIGGDEFAIVTQHAGAVGAKRIISAMEATFNKIMLPDATALSASFGTALFNNIDTKAMAPIKNSQVQQDHIYALADIELYKSKMLKKAN
jgi:diguanylate cyclase (GGDEF)-like protein